MVDICACGAYMLADLLIIAMLYIHTVLRTKYVQYCVRRTPLAALAILLFCLVQ